ncbi:MAG: hypothetical protein OEV49_12950 [candidate division Zixibacteria bacterium]|nr:hypothetical protein [candidate division Zixibacteria bacterium]MDH3938670.1 hypothetical protein [candidate division Zixibacteria bacterium]
MKRLVIVALLLLVCVPQGFARRKKAKAGKIENGVFTDKEYGFQMTLPENWKTKTGDQKGHFRLTLVQKNYEVPPDYQDAPDYTQVPRIVVWADTTTLGAAAFIDSLVSNTFKSDQKKEVFKEFDLLNEASAGSGTYRDPVVQKGRKTIKIDGAKGLRYSGRATYMKEVALSASSTGGGKRVRGAYGGTVVALKQGNTVVVFHMMCEWNYYKGIDQMMMNMVNALTWAGSDDESKS